MKEETTPDFDQKRTTAYMALLIIIAKILTNTEMTLPFGLFTLIRLQNMLEAHNKDLEELISKSNKLIVSEGNEDAVLKLFVEFSVDREIIDEMLSNAPETEEGEQIRKILQDDDEADGPFEDFLNKLFD